MPNYLDEIEYIRPGGTGRGGKLPDRLVKVLFLKLMEDGHFAFLYTKDNDQVGYGRVKNIITVNGIPLNSIYPKPTPNVGLVE